MYRRVLLPFDGSELALQAALDGIEFARMHAAQVIVLFVTRPYPALPVYPGEVALVYPPRGAYARAVRQAALARMDDIMAAARKVGVKCSKLVASSDRKAETIVESARRRHCDLIVMGSHGRSGARQWVLGSVTNKVLSMSSIPVLVHRPRTPAARMKKRAGASRARRLAQDDSARSRA
jgi:nucleotide-binding universal stress UspA family protein